MIALVLIAIGALLTALISAPKGHEDTDGFHYDQ